jgi:hypothetical protein
MVRRDINGRRDGSLMAIDGAALLDIDRWQGTARLRRQWRWTAITTVMDSNGRRWTTQWQLDGDGRRDGSLGAMDGKGWHKRDANGL